MWEQRGPLEAVVHPACGDGELSVHHRHRDGHCRPLLLLLQVEDREQDRAVRGCRKP